MRTRASERASAGETGLPPDTYPVFEVLGGLVLGVGHVILAVSREPRHLWTAKKIDGQQRTMSVLVMK